MRYFLGYAGIPHDFYNLVSSHASSIVLENSEFFGYPVRNNPMEYSKEYALRFEQKFAERLEGNDKEVLRRLGFGTVYIASVSVDGDRALTETLFPSVLTARVEWTQVRDSPTRQRESANELCELLRGATR